MKKRSSSSSGKGDAQAAAAAARPAATDGGYMEATSGGDGVTITYEVLPAASVDGGYILDGSGGGPVQDGGYIEQQDARLLANGAYTGSAGAADATYIEAGASSPAQSSSSAAPSSLVKAAQARAAPMTPEQAAAERKRKEEELQEAVRQGKKDRVRHLQKQLEEENKIKRQQHKEEVKAAKQAAKEEKRRLKEEKKREKAEEKAILKEQLRRMSESKKALKGVKAKEVSKSDKDAIQRRLTEAAATSRAQDQEIALARWKAQPAHTRYKAVQDYQPAEDGFLQLRSGDLVTLTQQREDGWGAGKNVNSGVSGIFPLDCVKYDPQ